MITGMLDPEVPLVPPVVTAAAESAVLNVFPITAPVKKMCVIFALAGT